ncbi:MAG: VCBS repeat-containing protein [Rubrivivax sp.]
MTRPLSAPRRAHLPRLAGGAALALLLAALGTARDGPRHEPDPATGPAMPAAPATGGAMPATTWHAPAAAATPRVAVEGAGPSVVHPSRSAAPWLPAAAEPFAPGGDEFLAGFDAAPSRDGAAASRRGAAAATAAPSTSRATLPPAPLLTLRLDRALLRAGETAWLNLSTSGAIGCSGVQGVAGALPLQGRVAVTDLAPGRHTLRVACRGAGGTVEQAVLALVPLPVAPDSRDNRRRAEADAPWRQRATWWQATLSIAPAALAGADFLQDGQLALFAARPGADGRTRAHFEALDDEGRWQDRSAELLPDAQERALCEGATQALVTDLNGDGRPDLYLACADGPQWLLLSTPDGRYRRAATPFALAALQAEAWDADGDGLVDIVTTVAAGGAARTLLLAGRGDGRLEPVASTPAAAQGRR